MTTIAELKHEISMLDAEITIAKARYKRLVARFAVMEERTIAHESRLEQLEEWRDNIDDKLEAS